MDNEDKVTTPDSKSLSDDDIKRKELIEKSFKADREEREKDNEATRVEKTKTKKVGAGLIAIALLAIAAIITGIVLFNPMTGVFIDKHKQNGGAAIETSSTPTANGNHRNGNEHSKTSDDEFWKDKQYPTPDKLEDWQTKAYDDKNIDNKKVETAVYVVPGVNSSEESLPSIEAGFTDDVNKVNNPDGTLNPMYTYWSREGFNHAVAFATERFINPDFGNWREYQYPSSKNIINDPNHIPQLFNDIYDPAYLQQMKDKPVSSWVPIYADWQSNDYGMGDQLLSSGPRWIGVLDNMNVQFTNNDKGDQYVAKVSANVTYYAWTQDQGKVTKKGIITFDVIQGPTNNRYLISNTNLEIK